MRQFKIYIALFLFLVTAQCSLGQDLKLWYTKPAVKWTEALPIGNGRIGAMLFGGVGKDRIQFNEDTLWSDYPRDYNRKGAYKYLDTIRQLLFESKQREAEDLAGKEFMGLKSDAGKKEAWMNDVLSLKGVNGNLALESFDDNQWKIMTVPSWNGWEAEGFEGLDGAVWLRIRIEIPSSWIGKDLVLDLNRIRDYDRTYVNGKLVGSQDNTEPRKYIISKDLLHAGSNLIAVQVLNFNDKGGISGYKDTTRHIAIYPQGEERSMISLNGKWKYFVQNDNPPPVGEYEASYQPFGDLWLQFDSTKKIEDYKRSLDIQNALSTTSYTQDGIEYKREYFVSQPNQVLVVHLTASKKGALNFSASLSSPHKYSSVRQVDDHTLALSVQVKNGALKGESYLLVQAPGGKIVVNNGELSITNADEATLYLSAGTNYKNYKDVTGNPAAICKSALEGLAGKSYEQVKHAHIKEYQQYFNAFSISFGKSANEFLPTAERIEKFPSSNDPAFVALYIQYGRYLLISSSRPGTRPANLQGIWNDLLNPPWGSKYTTNINLEMNYWPAELLNMSPMAQPLFEMIKELSISGKETAKEYYNAPGWVLHHNTDLWRGTAPINASNHGIWVSGGAWLCHHLWEHYLFTYDTAFLRTTGYPIMKEAALFFNSYLVKDPVTGYLISGPSNSPEQGGLVMGPTMDHEIIRDLFKNVIESAKILNVDQQLQTTLQDKYSKIAPLKIGRYGQLQEWMKDVDDTANKHRHISHLWALYPGNEINWEDNPEFVKAARQSLIYRGDAATGWSLAWKINCWARFKEGDHAFRLIQMLLGPSNGGEGSYPNMFDAHPPFQIDGNFGGSAGIGELLVQSHTKYVDILPALPSSLPNGEVKGICARGAFVLNMKWVNGKLQHLSVISKAGVPLWLRYNGKVINMTTSKNMTYQFDGALNKL
jgi:alpha-L-fucosidase 2